MGTLILEAYGQLAPGTNLINPEEEDLYSVFRARAGLMGWSTTSGGRSLLWEMNEAELTAGSVPSLIGYVQVGLEVGDIERTEVPPPAPGLAYAPLGVRRRPIEPAKVLPALVQCFDDALRRFGDVELSALQVAAYGLDSSTRLPAHYLFSEFNWFNLTPKGGADALIAFDQGLLGGHTEAELAARLRRWNTRSFEFGQVAAVPEQHAIRTSIDERILSVSPTRSGLGVTVKMPEWTASAVGWVLAAVIDTARDIAPDVSGFAVRVTRVR